MLGQRLKLARHGSGLSLQGLAARLDPPVSAQALSKYERGLMTPSSAVLIGLATGLSVSLDYLIGGGAEAIDHEDWHFPDRPTAKLRVKAQALVLERVEACLSIDAILPSGPVFNARLPGKDETVEEPSADCLADRIRDHWRLGDGPIASLTAALERHGSWVFALDLPDRMTGLRYRAHRPDGATLTVIAVSDHTPVERKRLVLAEEIVRQSMSRPNGDIPPDRKETAAALLLPRAPLIQAVGARRERISGPEIFDLKRYFGVPAIMVLDRLADLGVISRAALRHTVRTVAKGWRRVDPAPIGTDQGFSTLERPRRLETAVWRALAEGAISPIRAARFLQIPLATVEAALREAQAA